MASEADTQTDRQTDTHTYTLILTCEPKQFQETRRAWPSAARAWFKKYVNLCTHAYVHNYILNTWG